MAENLMILLGKEYTLEETVIFPCEDEVMETIPTLQ